MADRTVAEIIERDQSELLKEWIRRQKEDLSSRQDVSDAELQTDSRNLLAALRETIKSDAQTDIHSSEWARVRDLLADLSRRRVLQGFAPSQTATFVLSLKQPLFDRLVATVGSNMKVLTEQIWFVTALLDKLALFTTEVFQKTREELISRQQQEMMELSTPVVELWHGILALPLIGTLDSNRTQVVMQNLLEAIVSKEADIAIIDITGVPTVDTLVAQHLLKTVAAARLMGAECIISGIRPQIAQTIIHLGVDLGNVITKATLADAFKIALRTRKLTVTSM
ncbi:MAG: STAS domain-containing protein [Bryobacteraceae bacterium]